MKNKIFLFSRDKLQCKNIPLIDRKKLLGNKGANLVEMCSIGINVPPGFILSTELCKYEEIEIETVTEKLSELQSLTGKQFGSEKNPLLLSVRSGAVVSMPGMMDTVLNIGLNDKIVESLANVTGNKIFAYDSYRRLIEMYGTIVLGIEEDSFNSVVARYDLTKLNEIQEVIVKLKELVLEEVGKPFPQDVNEQLISAISAVFKSWNSERARVYRERNGINHNLSTAATVQTMVFGNMGDNSYTGVLFTRNPITGEKALFGEFLPNAQGEDIVSGKSNTYQLTKLDCERSGISEELSLEASQPKLFGQLQDVSQKLELHFKDMQDIEFTIEEGKLWILQTRSGKRSSASAMKIAIDIVREGMKSEEEALKDIPSTAIEQSIHKQLIVKDSDKPIAKGLAASPGAASGIVALTSKSAEILSKSHPVILIRNETSPEDIAGMYSSEGIITARGGVTSHAAVVARGIGKPCICSVENLIITNDSLVSINGVVFNEGDYITINGSTGQVFEGYIDMSPTSISSDFVEVLSWMDKYKKIDVMANAETPEDVRTAITFGASGIGLCRTEHMFFAKERINDVRRMILAESQEDRKEILVKLGKYQREDFIELFEILDGKSLSVRLLDPPLHEFLPGTDSDIEEYCYVNNEDIDKVKNIIKSLHEYNPMLGHRGVRLGVTHKDIYQCQAKALFEAASLYKDKFGKNPQLEIMIPLIFSESELLLMKDMIKNIYNDLKLQNKLNYKFGAMIELPRIALIADRIANHVDFISFGTNDLTQTTFGVSRDDSSKFLNEYIKNGMISCDPFISIDREGVGQLMKIAIEKIRSSNKSVKIGVCGEHGGDEKSIDFFYEIGCDYLSCSPYRVPVAKLTASKIN